MSIKIQFIGFGMGLSFILSLFNSIVPILGGYDGARWISFFAIFLALIGLIFLIIRDFHIKKTVLIFAIPFFVTTIFLGRELVGNKVVFLAYETLYWMASALLGIYLGLACKKSSISELSRGMLLVVVVSLSIYVLTIIMGFGFWYGGGAGTVTDYLPFGFYNMRMWSHVATWLIPLGCAISITVFDNKFSFTNKYIIFLYFAFGCWFMVLLGSGARGSLVAQVLSLLILAVLYRQSFYRIARFWLISFAVGCLLYGIFVVLVPWFVFEHGEVYTPLRSGLSGRLALWSHAFSLSMDNFPGGVGALGYILNTPEDALGSPHSFYLRWAAEYGWLVLFAFILGLVTLSWRGWRCPMYGSADDCDLSYQIAVQWSVLAAFIHAGVSGIFTSSISQLVGFPILILYFAYMASYHKTDDQIDNRIFQSIGLGCAGVMMALALLMVQPMYSWWQSALADQSDYFEIYQRPLAPRFWLHGRFVQDNPEFAE